jgi:ribonuclease D
MTPVSDTGTLSALCERLASEAFVTVDTEFMRESTYYSKLCLIQVAGRNETAAIDALADGLDLAPFLALMDDPSVLKVMHAARQDMEIFFNLSGRLPAPLFDTQIAAMVCGFGDSVSYDKLVARITGVRLDKSSRFADWSQRPLTEKQLTYALSDVTHLRDVYVALSEQLEVSGRSSWLDEEIGVLTDTETYRVDPENTWTRIKVKSGRRRFLAILRELAALREVEAQRRNVPRQRVIRDDVLLDIAAHTPKTREDLARTRSFNAQQAASRFGQQLDAVVRGQEVPEADCPSLPPRPNGDSQASPAIVEMLKVLLRMKAEQNDVAAKLIAQTSDLEAIALDDEADVPAMSGWRREIFGDEAVALKHGRIALTVRKSQVAVIDA